MGMVPDTLLIILSMCLFQEYFVCVFLQKRMAFFYCFKRRKFICYESLFNIVVLLEDMHSIHLSLKMYFNKVCKKHLSILCPLSNPVELLQDCPSSVSVFSARTKLYSCFQKPNQAASAGFVCMVLNTLNHPQFPVCLPVARWQTAFQDKVWSLKGKVSRD